MKTLIAALLLSATSAFAADLSFEGGKLSDTTRVSLALDTKPFYTAGNLSASLHYNLTQISQGDDSLTGASVVPMLTYRIRRFYIDGGIGAAVFDGTRLNNQSISTAFQFSDNLGFGIQITEGLRVGYRFTHFSNAGIKKPNPGIDTQQIYVVGRF